ncbi:MAG: hypothetical protein V1918_05255 [Planctomycetota bacterium]
MIKIQNNQMPPIMCNITPLKKSVTGFSFLQNQRNRFKEVVTRCQKVAIVGVEIRPHDTHIWGPLAETDAKIIYCSGPDSEKKYNDWSKDARPGKKDKDISLNGYFKECFDDLCGHLGI